MASLALAAAALGAVAVASCARRSAAASTGTWRLAGSAPYDYVVGVDSSIRHGGRRSAHIHAATNPPWGFLSLQQSIRADRYRGMRVRLSGYLRADHLDADAVLFMRADAIRGNQFGSSATTPVSGTADWTRVEVELNVPSSAYALLFGVTLDGAGDLWVDDLRLEPVSGERSESSLDSLAEARARELPDDPEALDFEPEGISFVSRSTVPAGGWAQPRPLTARGRENLEAFARLLALVRFFNPSEAALSVNWDDVALRGVRAAEPAASPSELATALQGVFGPIAPTVSVMRTSAVGPREPTCSACPDTGAGVLYWRHAGVDLTAAGATRRPGPYSSVLTWEPVPRPDTANPAPDPRRPVRADLPGGVTAVVPIALRAPPPERARDRGRMPSPAAPSEPAANADRTTRLAAVAVAWGVMQHFYPYFDVTRTDWSAELPRALSRAATDATRAAFDTTLMRLVAALRDGHGSVSIRAPATRLLPFAWDWVENALVVTYVPDTMRTALRRGDVIAAVDGRSSAHALQAEEELVSGATPQWIRYRGLQNLARGRRGSTLALDVRRGGATMHLTATRDTSQPVSEPRPDKVAELSPGIMYVDLDRISDQDFNAALPGLERARGIVFDLRGYPRQVNTPAILAHLTDQRVRSGLFEIPQTSEPDRRRVSYHDGGWPVQPAAPRLTARTAFITDGRAISYAETTMGIVEAFHLADIVGEPTAGTNGNVNPFTLPGGSSIGWTGMRVRKQDGSRHHGVGILPTLPAHRTLRGVAEGRDELLERAVALVEGPVGDR